MMTLDNRCNVDQIDACLSGGLPEQDAQSLEEHLETCPSCRRAIARRAAGPQTWNRVKSYLQDDANDLHPLAAETSDAASVDDYQRLIDALAPSDDPRMLGRLGPYEITGIVGAGGMGIVLKAFDPALARFIAIKVLVPRLWRDDEARARFSREARSAAAVVHDNIIEVYGVFESKDFPYFTMPYLRGETLQQRIDRRGPLSVSEILSISRQLAAGLAAAHAQGLVHRDVKPANIFLTEGAERLLITDFGLAKSATDARLTQTDVLPGTPAFMSPEQVQGKTVDHRSDLFSLAGVMYMMASGRCPFAGKTPFELLQHVCDARPRRLEQIAPTTPTWLAAIIDRLHQASPDERYQSAAELAGDLEACLAHEHSPRVWRRPKHIGRLQSRYVRSAHPLRLRGLSQGLGAAAIALVIWVAFQWLGQAAAPPTGAQANTGERSAGSAVPEQARPTATSPVAVAGLVVDDDGRPLAGVKVLAVQKLWPDNRYQQRSMQTTTDADGKFEFKNFAPGGEQYAFLLTALSEQHAMVSEYRVVRDGSVQEPIRLKTTSAPATLVIVKDESGRPVTGAQVMPGERTTADGAVHLTYAMQITDGGQPTDRQGRVTLHAFQPGETGELTIDVGGRLSDYEITVTKDRPVEVVVKDADPIPASEPVSVSGKLVDADNRPIAGETVYVVRKRWPNNRYRQDGLTVKTNQQGEFTLSEFASIGSQYAFLLTAIVDGYLMSSEYRLVKDGAQQDPVTLRLQPAGPVRFTLKDNTGNLVVAAQIAPMSRTAADTEALNYVLNAKGSARTTNEEGQVQFTAWAPGETGRVFCTHNDTTSELQFTVPKSREVELVLHQ